MNKYIKQAMALLNNTPKMTFLFNKKAVLYRLSQILLSANSVIYALRKDNTILGEELVKNKRNALRYKKDYEQADNELFEAQEALGKAQHDLTKKDQEVKGLANTLEKSKKQQHVIQDKLRDIELRETLVGCLIVAKNENPDVQAFDDILHGDFMEFANEESSLAEEATAVLKLQSISDELHLISAFSAFHTKRTVAVAGGFSAGKSEFISSLFDDEDEMRLPSSLEPTTAIPTYVMNHEDDEASSLIGVSSQGGTINLTEIDRNIDRKLTHQFVQDFKFPLKDIMPYMFLTRKLPYQNLCFVDTPGYNPASGKGLSTEYDVEVAQTYVKNAEALIWLVGADANGTIPKTDIEFIQKLELNDRPIYFVLNKADLKAPTDIDAIIENFQQVLDDANIPFSGICAYNAIDGVVLQQTGMELATFLQSIDKPSDKYEELTKRIYEVHGMYQTAITKDMESRENLAQVINTISLDLAEANFKSGTDEIYDRLDDIEAQFDTKLHKQQLQTLEKVTEAFVSAVRQIFGKVDDVSESSSDSNHSLERLRSWIASPKTIS